MTTNSIELAAEAIRNADAILIGAGAGMGVDSGLPDFRGDEGFWNAYPPFKRLGLSFYDLADPIWFHRNPKQAWGFYGHRMNLYRATEPHRGFSILKNLVQNHQRNYFVFTSNVDGHFHASGFDEECVIECHGAISFLQCAKPCCYAIWPADEVEVVVDEGTFLAEDPLPTCIKCGGIARPNILMFGDGSWLPNRTQNQSRRYSQWHSNLTNASRLVGIEMGAGTAVPTVRRELDQQTRRTGCTLIRINPRDSQTRDGISIGLAAKEALDQIAEAI